jgi:putative DNA primase/helicase
VKTKIRKSGKSVQNTSSNNRRKHDAGLSGRHKSAAKRQMQEKAKSRHSGKGAVVAVNDVTTANVPENTKNAPDSRYLRTDVGNAEMFSALYADRLRYDHKRGRWLIWKDGRWWVKDQTARAVAMAKQVARLRLTQGGDNDKETKWALRSEARQRLEAMVELAKSETALADSGEGWDSDPWLLGVPNGVVDLRTGQLRGGKQSDKITLHSKIAFDPTAKAPRWERFINEIFDGNTELIEYVQRAVGYSITGDIGEQVVFLAFGSGANGKSTFVEMIRNVLGEQAYNLPFSAFELHNRSSIPNDIAALEGRRFTTAIETSESSRLNEARIKALTGSDPITARYLYGEFFTFVPTAKFWLVFNHFPQVMDDSEGFWRRVRVIPFERQFSKDNRDNKLLEKLKAEASGILNWAIEGARKWKEQGLDTPAIVTQLSEQYRQESDVLAEFIEDCCELDPDASTTSGALWHEYLRWKQKQGDEDVIDRTTFGRKLQARGCKKMRVGQERTRGWRGIRLKSDDLDEFFNVGPQPALQAAQGLPA